MDDCQKRRSHREGHYCYKHSVLRLLYGGLLSCALMLGGAASANDADFHWIVHHPGELELLYFPHYKTNFEKATVAGREFIVPMGVTPPSAQSLYLLSRWDIKPGESVLDIGTGSGVQAVFAAELGAHVIATDISEKAVLAARENLSRHGMAERVEVRQGDLFAPIGEDELFDVILFNIDYPVSEFTQSLWTVHERFFAAVAHHIKPGGRIYYQSGLIANIPRIQAMADKNGLRITRIHMDAALEVDRDPIVYVLYRKSDIEALKFKQAKRKYQHSG